MNIKKIIIFIILIVIAATGIILLNSYRESAINLSLGFLDRINTINTLTIQNKEILDNTKPFIIKIAYPQIDGLDDFNQKAKTIVDKEINNFKINSLENDKAVKDTNPTNYAEYPREYDLNIGYDQGEVNSDIISIIFNVYNFEGGAHGAGYFVPLNYDVKNKKEIRLADLFLGQTDYLQKISEFCIKDLTKQMTASGGIEMTNASWINRGAGAAEENFQFFLINKNDIVFYFPQYQVAAYAAGDFKVIYPR